MEQNQPTKTIDNIYDICLKSNDWILDRCNAMDNKTDRLLASIIFVTIGVIAIIAQNQTINFNSWYFAISMIFFISSVIFGLVSELKGSLTILSPQLLYKKALGKDEYNFKNITIKNSARNYLLNLTLINKKGLFTTISGFLFLVEVIFLVLWIILPPLMICLECF